MRLPILTLLALAACYIVPEDFPGSVYEITDQTVTVRGMASLDGKPARPTLAMRNQAEEICPGAEYLSANPYPYDELTFLYLFKC